MTQDYYRKLAAKKRLNRQKWLRELGYEMALWGMTTTGSPEIDLAIDRVSEQRPKKQTKPNLGLIFSRKERMKRLMKRGAA